jgi:hypothetical protein
LREWGNLYKYSQQGWESFNLLIKSIYFPWTQRSGNSGKKDEPASWIAPITCWLQRKLFYLGIIYSATMRDTSSWKGSDGGGDCLFVDNAYIVNYYSYECCTICA